MSMCSMCSLKPGRTYPISSPARCTKCNYEFGTANRDLEYLELYGECLHRFRLCNPITCPRCSHVTKVVLITCETFSQMQKGKPVAIYPPR
jgi:hypothetical protein